MDQRKKRAALIFVMLAMPLSVAADDWFAPTRVVIRTGMLLHRDYLSVTMITSASGDTRIDVKTFANGKTRAGQLLLVGGRILLVKDVEITPGAEIDAVDAPALEVQLALKLLAKAVPSGPSAVTSTWPIQLSDQNEPIEVSTPSASGEYQAPWTLRGGLKRESSARVSFNLTFAFKGAPQPLTISGSWKQTNPAPVFPDSLSVIGWRAFKLGPYSKQDAGGTILDYGAQELPHQFRTLGEARAEAKSGHLMK
jgi:hypothetical protein